MRQQQRGMTFIGLLCVLALVGMVVYAGIRLTPVYLNYMKVSRTMDTSAKEAQGENPDPGAIRRLIERHWQIEFDTPYVIDAKDIEIVKDDGGIKLHVAYDDKADYVANVFLLVHFEKTVTVR
jgi:Domain of unknown function (DUF4845)